MGGFSWEDEDDEEDDESSGRVRFSGMPIEVIQVTLPFEKVEEEEEEEAQDQNETMTQDNNKGPSPSTSDFVPLPAKRNEPAQRKGDTNPSKRPRIPNE